MITDKLSQISANSLLGRALRLPLRLVPDRAIVRVRSGLNKDLRWVAGSSVHGCWLGHYEQEKQILVRQLVKPGMKVFDIGANVGFYTLAFSRLVTDSGHVWAFEPAAQNASNLLRHLQLNNIVNTTLIQSAVSSTVGVAGLRTEFSNSEWKLSDAPGNYLVPTVTLDALIADGTVPIPDIIKMDVEGAESCVLEGATNILRQGRSTLLVAVHGDEQFRRCMGFLNAARYQVYGLDGQPLSLASQYADEIYATRNDVQTAVMNLT